MNGASLELIGNPAANAERQVRLDRSGPAPYASARANASDRADHGLQQPLQLANGNRASREAAGHRRPLSAISRIARATTSPRTFHSETQARRRGGTVCRPGILPERRRSERWLDRQLLAGTPVVKTATTN